LDTLIEEVMTASLSRRYNAYTPQGRTETRQKESGKGNVDGGLQEDGGGSSRQRWRIEWSVAYAPLGTTRHKSSKS